MLYINFKGNTPQQRFYTLGVQRNNKANKIRFILEKQQADLNLSDYICNLKIESKENEYLDLIMLEKVSETETELVYEWVMPLKSTQYRNLELQLEFLGEEEIVWQTMIFGIELSDTIKVGDTVDDKKLSVLKQMEYQVDKNKKDIANLKDEVKEAKEIVIGDPNDYLNENGLNKIIRVEDENGSVEKSYMIDKTVVPSTLVVCEQHREENDFEYTTFPNTLITDLGYDNFHSIFGENADWQKFKKSFSLYYDHNGVVTKGIRYGVKNEEYGVFELTGCEPNKIIKLVVGKYFEYDENGNKVFDDICGMYSECFAPEQEGIVEDIVQITEEKQIVVLRTGADGYFYFDSDASVFGLDKSRFILYSIMNDGEPEQVIYEAKELGGGDEYIAGNGIDITDYTISIDDTVVATKTFVSENYATKSSVESISSLIPAQASPTNKLADKDFVNSSIATNTAYFKGTYNVVNDLGLTVNATHEQIATALGNEISNPTNNDYAFVSFPDPIVPSEYTKFSRYKYNSDTETWAFEFDLNNSSFTAEQWASINSGISSSKVASYDSHLLNTNNPHQVNKTQVGLSNVDNTSDIDKPVSTLQAQAIKKIANDIAEDYSDTSIYNVDDVVSYNNQLYICVNDITVAETFDPNKWRQVSVAELLNGKVGFKTLSINCYAPIGDATILNGIEIKINDNADNEIASGIYNGSTLNFKLPLNQTYKIVIETQSLTIGGITYFAPDVESGTSEGALVDDTTVSYRFNSTQSITTLRAVKTFINLPNIDVETKRLALVRNENNSFSVNITIKNPDNPSQTYTMPVYVADVDIKEKLVDNTPTNFLGGRICFGYELPDSIPFDEREQVQCDDGETFQDGIYYYTATTSGIGDKEFTPLTAGVDYQVGDSVDTYETTNDVFVFKHAWANGSGSSSTANLIRYGSNIYHESNIDQWLNSLGDDWFVPKHLGDILATWYVGKHSFLDWLDEDTRNLIEEVAYGVYERNGHEVSNNKIYRKVVLMSGTEVAGSVNANEGTVFDYWKYLNGGVIGNNANANRTACKITNITSKQTFWLRSPNRGYSNSAWNVHSNGNVSYYYASYSFAVLPSFTI